MAAVVVAGSEGKVCADRKFQLFADTWNREQSGLEQ